MISILLATFACGAIGGASLASWWWVRRERALLRRVRRALVIADFDHVREPLYAEIQETARAVRARIERRGAT